MNELEELGYKYLKAQIDKMIDGHIPMDRYLIDIYSQYARKKNANAA